MPQARRTHISARVKAEPGNSTSDRLGGDGAEGDRKRDQTSDEQKREDLRKPREFSV